jgi:fido (protein-threonine AMPylation protein)
MLDWDYERFPNYREILGARVAELVRELFRPNFPTADRTSKTRSTHKRLFSGLTPPLYPGFAGNYRGCDLPELNDYKVGVPSDPRVGIPPMQVLSAMNTLAAEISRGIVALDDHQKQKGRAELLTYAIQFACAVFEVFLRIHPYANGNGHVARWIMWALLGRYQFRFRGFPIEPKPGPPYSDLIKAHRSGDRAGLEAFVLSAIDPSTASKVPATEVSCVRPRIRGASRGNPKERPDVVPGQAIRRPARQDTGCFLLTMLRAVPAR